MVVSLNKGTPIQAPKYYNPYFWDPKKVPPILAKPHVNVALASKRKLPEDFTCMGPAKS